MCHLSGVANLETTLSVTTSTIQKEYETHTDTGSDTNRFLCWNQIAMTLDWKKCPWQPWWVNLGGAIMLDWIVVTPPALYIRYSPRAYQVIIETSVLVTIPVCLFLFIVGICLTNLLVAQLLDSISRLSPRKSDDGNKDFPLLQLYSGRVAECHILYTNRNLLNWVLYWYCKALVLGEFPQKFHDLALCLSISGNYGKCFGVRWISPGTQTDACRRCSTSLRLSQSYHDAYSNMQGYARLNRASITNTTVQDCHCVESVFATAKFESSPLSSWLQSADSLLGSLSLLVFLCCDRHPERFEAAVSFLLFSYSRQSVAESRHLATQNHAPQIFSVHSDSCVQIVQGISVKRWTRFLESLKLDDALEFNEGDVGLSGGHLNFDWFWIRIPWGLSQDCNILRKKQLHASHPESSNTTDLLKNWGMMEKLSQQRSLLCIALACVRHLSRRWHSGIGTLQCSHRHWGAQKDIVE